MATCGLNNRRLHQPWSACITTSLMSTSAGSCVCIRTQASFGMALLALWALLVNLWILQVCQGAVHDVGGGYADAYGNNWGIPRGLSFYQQVADATTFTSDDTLYFKFDPLLHNVVAVKLHPGSVSSNPCHVVARPIATSRGEVLLGNLEPGETYQFSSNMGDQCELGMHFHILVAGNADAADPGGKRSRELLEEDDSPSLALPPTYITKYSNESTSPEPGSAPADAPPPPERSPPPPPPTPSFVRRVPPPPRALFLLSPPSSASSQNKESSLYAALGIAAGVAAWLNLIS